ncbi:hypothetical protein NQ314_017155 [Rhamnusium bicolor]|uniref:Uncharacterized protein n=1 Tax=Rhamnusium bicolor TaxID=1586634 RepID=A0AAV8WU42_9CUCU|nr:hypothetical protein NQ314_017155 [Rhamnusium bicolor]
MSYEADQARLLYLVEETNPYVSEYDDSADEKEPDNDEVLDINTDYEQELSDSERDSTVTSLVKMDQQSGKNIFLIKT